ncbi:CoA ester lyase [Alphaproteobacteria bacterium]|nr:CoA ester lyase [Alphaproteobacteria bacterium]
MNHPKIELNRSYLFVPANRPERFSKAVNSGADVVIIDLEDAVPSDEKNLARQTVFKFFEENVKFSIPVYLRVNSMKNIHGLKDVIALTECNNLPFGIVIPMVDSPEEVSWYDNYFKNISSNLKYIIVIETAIGLENVESIAFSSDNIFALGFGSADYTSQTGSNLDWDSLLYARSKVVNAAAMAGIYPVDGVWPDIKDSEGLEYETKKVSLLGFNGKMAIHPSQIIEIHKGFKPSSKEIEFAKKVVSVYENSGGGVITVEGKMIDEPLVVSARKIIALSD